MSHAHVYYINDMILQCNISLWQLQLYTTNKFNIMRVDIFSFPASDAGELTKMQTRLNQWMTAKTLVKYEIHTAGEFIIFNVCRKKEQE